MVTKEVLCLGILRQFNGSNVDAAKYGYGSGQWNHGFHRLPEVLLAFLGSL